ncbi:MAG: formate dehydrogenase subunit gamma [Paracoccus sp. (in: a-proteobacteria)]|nr:formate dehydrogenase subunit gamma [Paracoccus sp. (in: a-proteobacteria)]
MSMIFQRICATLLLAALLGAAPMAEAQVSDQQSAIAATDAAAAETAAGTPALVELGNQVNPTASAVHEEALFDALGTNQPIVGRISIPDENAANLIKPANRGWAGTNSGLLEWVTIGFIVLTLLALVGFFLFRGRIRIEKGFSGVKITRFTGLERFAHWLMAVSFILLALTGLNLVIGRSVILPLIGENAFGAMTSGGKVIHNYVGWAFMIGMALAFVLWVGRNIPKKKDLEWLRQFGGLFQKGVHPPAGKFNAGQKIIFWSVVLGGSALAFTGVMLLFPSNTADASQWQTFQLVHGFAAAIMTAIIIVHIYIGTIGMEGAFDAMGSGEVDLNWAKEHHPDWVEEKQAKGTAPSSAPPSSRPPPTSRAASTPAE